MKKFILLLCALLMLVTVIQKNQENFYIIPDKAIRVRIVPNSNNLKDIFIKKEVKNNLELELENDLKKSKTIESSRKIIKTNINKYKKIVGDIIKVNDSNSSYSIDYGNHYFPEKSYKGIKYKKGYYESLLITLGKGEGSNWWCVLFPPICSLEEDTNMNKIEYTTYVKEIFKKYF